MKYIRGLDGLRAFSVLLVLAAHMGVLSLLPATFWYEHRFYELFSSTLGVHIFFVISGFLITRLLLRERQEHGRIHLKNFFIRRFLRLMPVLYLYLSIQAVLMAMGIMSRNWLGLAIAAFYMFNFAPRIVCSNELSHLWSLAVEEQFYLIWPLMLAGLAFTYLVPITLVVILLCAYFWLFPLAITLDFQAPWIQSLVQSFHLNAANYGKYFVDGRYFQLKDAFNIAHWTIPAEGVILIGCLFAILPREGDRRWAGHWVWITALVLYLSPLYLPEAVLPLMIVAQAVAAGLFILYLLHRQDSAAARALEFRPLRYLGKISYGVYLWHGLFITVNGTGPLWFQKSPLNVLLTAMVSVLSFEFFEKPFLNLKRKFR